MPHGDGFRAASAESIRLPPWSRHRPRRRRDQPTPPPRRRPPARRSDAREETAGAGLRIGAVLLALVLAFVAAVAVDGDGRRRRHRRPATSLTEHRAASIRRRVLRRLAGRSKAVVAGPRLAGCDPRRASRPACARLHDPRPRRPPAAGSSIAGCGRPASASACVARLSVELAASTPQGGRGRRRAAPCARDRRAAPR